MTCHAREVGEFGVDSVCQQGYRSDRTSGSVSFCRFILYSDGIKSAVSHGEDPRRAAP